MYNYVYKEMTWKRDVRRGCFKILYEMPEAKIPRRRADKYRETADCAQLWTKDYEILEPQEIFAMRENKEENNLKFSKRILTRSSSSAREGFRNFRRQT